MLRFSSIRVALILELAGIITLTTNISQCTESSAEISSLHETTIANNLSSDFHNRSQLGEELRCPRQPDLANLLPTQPVLAGKMKLPDPVILRTDTMQSLLQLPHSFPHPRISFSLPWKICFQLNQVRDDFESSAKAKPPLLPSPRSSPGKIHRLLVVRTA